MADDSRVVRVPLKSYGSDDNDVSLSPRRRHSRWLWIAGIIFLVMNVIVLISIAIVGKTVSESLDRVTIVQGQQAVQALSAYNLPSKFAVQYVTPRQDQAHRGTCWDFATISLLEWSYRANGVRNGWLKDDEYVAFSEQCMASKSFVYARERKTLRNKKPAASLAISFGMARLKVARLTTCITSRTA
ncbi:hypothetical protein AC1031_013131 [Aphanomyces cochlioides]|nr:hypothetical protein AC1031_013131 [Aphanomyces cochlioides]